MTLDGLFMDMYGTVTTGDRQAVETVCEHILRDTGLDLTPRDLGITWGERFFHAMERANGADFATLFDIEARTLRETMIALNAHLDPEPYIRELARYWQNPPLQPEVPEFLARCPLPICIVSNADRGDIDAALARHEIQVVGAVTSEDARSYKPDPQIFHDALRLTGWRPERVLHVGDSLHSDVGGARQVGLKSAWLNRAHRIHDIGTHEPDYELRDLNDLLPLINGY